MQTKVCVRQELPPLNPASRTFASLRTRDKEMLPLTRRKGFTSAHQQGMIAVLHLQQGASARPLTLQQRYCLCDPIREVVPGYRQQRNGIPLIPPMIFSTGEKYHGH